MAAKETPAKPEKSPPAVAVHDGAPAFELAAEILPYEFGSRVPPLVMRVRHYDPDDLLAALRERQPDRKPGKNEVRLIAGDQWLYCGIFDRIFVEAVCGKARDDDASHVKAPTKIKFIQGYLGGIVSTDAIRDKDIEPESGSLFSDGTEARLCFDMWAETELEKVIGTPGSVEIKAVHRFPEIDHQAQTVWDRATQSDKITGRRKSKAERDNARLAKMYDRDVIEARGYLINGAPCANANRLEWLPRMPLYHKLAAVNVRFEDEDLGN